MTNIYTLRLPLRAYNRQLLQSKAEDSALCNQAEVDLEEDEYCSLCDKGTEAGVFGREGLSRALGVRHRRPQQGLRGGGREGGQPKKIQYYYPPINNLESTGDYY